MAGARIEIDDKTFAGGLLRLDGLVARPRDMWDQVGAALAVSVSRRFQREVGPDGTAWKPSKRALRTGGKTLRLSGRLWQSVTHRPSDDGVEVGVSPAYAAAHQFGAKIERQAGTVTTFHGIDKRSGEISARFVKKGKAGFAQDHQHGPYVIELPARPFLGIDEEDRSTISEIVLGHVREAFAGRGAP